MPPPSKPLLNKGLLAIKTKKMTLYFNYCKVMKHWWIASNSPYNSKITIPSKNKRET